MNERVLTGEDFGRRVSGSGAGSVVLVPEAFRKYLAAYEEAVSEARAGAANGLRAMWREDVGKLATAIREGSEFEPYREGEG